MIEKCLFIPTSIFCTCRATIRALGDEIMIMKSDMRQLAYEAKEQKEHIKDNIEKVKVNPNTSLTLLMSLTNAACIS